MSETFLFLPLPPSFGRLSLWKQSSGSSCSIFWSVHASVRPSCFSIPWAAAHPDIQNPNHLQTLFCCGSRACWTSFPSLRLNTRGWALVKPFTAFPALSGRRRCPGPPRQQPSMQLRVPMVQTLPSSETPRLLVSDGEQRRFADGFQSKESLLLRQYSTRGSSFRWQPKTVKTPRNSLFLRLLLCKYWLMGGEECFRLRRCTSVTSNVPSWS